MLRKICNYLAIIALSLIVTGNSVIAHPTVSKGKRDVKQITVDDDKDFNFYNEFLSGGSKHSYTIKVEAGKEVKLKVRASKSVALNIQAPSGQTTKNAAEKYFEVRLSAPGEYTVELEALAIAQYSLEVFNK
jgi:hypothetical protein